MACFSPVWASEMTSCTPASPRAFRLRRNAVQNAPSSAGDDVHAEDLPLPVGVDPGRDHHCDGDHPAALADLLGQRVHPHIGVGAGVQRPGAERLDLRVQHLGHPGHLRLGDPGDAERLDQLVHPPGRDPEQVAGGDHADQRLLGAAPAVQQPVREVRPRPQLRDRQLDRAGPGVPAPAPDTRCGSSSEPRCAPRSRRRTTPPPRRPSTRRERRDHLPQQIRAPAAAARPASGPGSNVLLAAIVCSSFESFGRAP